MAKLGCAERWRCLVMKCVTSVNYAIKVNGCPLGSITPTMGICQRYPLLPYLFLLCAEGLSSLIKASVANGVLKGTFPSIFLQMIALYFIKLQWRIVMSFNECWESIREPWANS